MSRYDTVRKIIDKDVVRVGTANLPDHKDNNSDILLIATEGDRCDVLSNVYYGTPKLWWFIASVNKLSSNNIPTGTQLRIPISPNNASMR
tara:strand:- start:1848 stop:2117 length:270 start_codon:yes stop_codon:yes gene_type:complete